MLDALFRTYTVASGTPFPDRLFDHAKPTGNGGGRARAWRQASWRGASAVLARRLAAAIRLTRAATTGVSGWHRRHYGASLDPLVDDARAGGSPAARSASAMSHSRKAAILGLSDAASGQTT